MGGEVEVGTPVELWFLVVSVTCADDTLDIKLRAAANAQAGIRVFFFMVSS
jgi:hypothetical protein